MSYSAVRHFKKEQLDRRSWEIRLKAQALFLSQLSAFFYKNPESIEEPNIARKVPYQEQTLVNFLINLSNITSTPFGRIIKRALNLNPTSFHFKLRK